MRTSNFVDRYLPLVIYIGLGGFILIGLAIKYPFSTTLSLAGALTSLIIITINAGMILDVLLLRDKKIGLKQAFKDKFNASKMLYFTTSTAFVIILCLFLFTEKTIKVILLAALLLVAIRAVILLYAKLALKRSS